MNQYGDWLYTNKGKEELSEGEIQDAARMIEDRLKANITGIIVNSETIVKDYYGASTIAVKLTVEDDA